VVDRAIIARARVFVLTHCIRNQLDGRGLIKCCRECGRHFKIGDVIVSIQGTKKTRWYCQKCARKFKFI